MRVAHLASYDEWTGATAVALAEVEALRLRGVEAFFVYRRGGTLEETMGGIEWAVPLFDPAASFIAERSALSRFLRSSRAQLVHAHLSHDHWISSLSTRLPRRSPRSLSDAKG